MRALGKATAVVATMDHGWNQQDVPQSNGSVMTFQGIIMVIVKVQAMGHYATAFRPIAAWVQIPRGSSSEEPGAG
jgi:hypothetical protein